MFVYLLKKFKSIRFTPFVNMDMTISTNLLFNAHVIRKERTDFLSFFPVQEKSVAISSFKINLKFPLINFSFSGAPLWKKVFV